MMNIEKSVNPTNAPQSLNTEWSSIIQKDYNDSWARDFSLPQLSTESRLTQIYLEKQHKKVIPKHRTRNIDPKISEQALSKVNNAYFVTDTTQQRGEKP